MDRREGDVHRDGGRDGREDRAESLGEKAVSEGLVGKPGG